jgi:hypothetical protein
VLPRYEFATRHSVRVAAEPGRADAALRAVTFREVPVVQALLAARGLGRRRPDERVLDAMRRLATVVEDVPGEGIVLSLEGRFWRPRGGGTAAPARAVVDFRAEPGRLTTETRVHVPDARSRRSFARYWRVVRPFSGLTRVLVLRAAKRRAEA